MNLKITFRHMLHTEALDEMIRKKCEKIEKLLSADTKVNMVCSIENSEHTCDIHIHEHTYHFYSNAKSDDLYKSFDLALHKMERQLHDHRDLLLKKHNHL